MKDPGVRIDLYIHGQPIRSLLIKMGVNVGSYVEHLKKHEIRKKGINNSHEYQKVDINEHNVMKILEFTREISFNSSPSPHTQMSYLTCLTRLAVFLGPNKEFKRATKKTLMDFFDELMTNPIKKVTFNTYSFKVRNFFWWLDGSKMDGNRKIYPPCINWNKPKKSCHKRLPEEIPDTSEVKRMIEVAERPVDAVVVSIISDGLMRVDELLRVKIGDFEWKDWGALLKIRSAKKEEDDRIVPLVHSVPYLKIYLNQHPFKKDLQSPLLVDVNKNRSWCFGRPYRYGAIYTIVRRLGRMAKTRYPVSPHKLRHYGIRMMSLNGVSEMVIRKIAGWVENSTMVETYIRLNNEQVVNTVLSKHHGIETAQTKKDEKMKQFEPIKCPKCSIDNPNENKFCYQCFSPLRSDAVVEIDETRKIIHQFLERMLAEPELREKFESWKKQDSNT